MSGLVHYAWFNTGYVEIACSAKKSDTWETDMAKVTCQRCRRAFESAFNLPRGHLDRSRLRAAAPPPSGADARAR